MLTEPLSSMQTVRAIILTDPSMARLFLGHKATVHANASHYLLASRIAADHTAGSVLNTVCLIPLAQHYQRAGKIDVSSTFLQASCMPKQAEVKAKVNVENMQQQTQTPGRTHRLTESHTCQGTWVLCRMEPEIGPVKPRLNRGKRTPN